MNQLSITWRGQRGTGKKTLLHSYLESIANKSNIPFNNKIGTWWLSKNDDEDGKSIPYEESLIHLGFDVARMSMSDKIFIQSILSRWSGQQDILLVDHKHIGARYLVLYHAHLLSDESIMQIQETIEQCHNFAVLFTSEYPVSKRLRDYFIEIPVPNINNKDYVLEEFACLTKLPSDNIWKIFFKDTMENWKQGVDIFSIRTWIYCCLQRNLRWSDVISYWLETIYDESSSPSWLSITHKKEISDYLSKVESGSGWTLINSYRIPIAWEYVHLRLALLFHNAWKQFQLGDTKSPHTP